MFRVLLSVFRHGIYTIIATIIAWVVFSVSVLLPNIELIRRVISSSANFWEKTRLVMSLYGSIGTNFTFISATYTILIAILFGMVMALLVYFVRTRRVVADSKKVSLAGLGGLLSGLLSIGCAACGTFLLSTFLPLFGAGWILVLLPFGGIEFGILGVILLSYSLYTLTKKIQEPLVCDDEKI